VSKPASSAQLRELLGAIEQVLDVPEDQPGAVLVASAGVWSALKALAVHDFDSEAVRAAIGVLRVLGRGPPPP
jgi:hypothetical protein